MTFVDAMRHRGVEVVFLRELLAETMTDPEARRWLLERRVNDNTVGVGLADELRAHLTEIDTDSLSNNLIRGIRRTNVPTKPNPVMLALPQHTYFFLHQHTNNL